MKEDEVPAPENTNNYALEHVVGLEYPRIRWWKHKGLRNLYVLMPFLFLGSTTNGYDGSLLNGLQTMEPWQSCKFDSLVYQILIVLYPETDHLLRLR